MPALLDSKSVASGPGISPSDTDHNRAGTGGPDAPTEPPRETSELDPHRSATPASAARLFTYFAMFWIVALFSTIAIVLESRWVNSKDWFSISLPPALYVDTLILLASSVSMEFARRSLRTADAKRCVRWIFLTAMLGAAFLAGQAVVWRELGLQNVRVAADPGIFFFYLITGAHGVLLLLGIVFLASAGIFVRRAGQLARRQFALGTVALYWQFVDALWLCLLGLLFTALQ